MQSKTTPHLLNLLLAIGLVASLFTMAAPPASVYAAGNISGTVFQDFNGDGLFNVTSTAALPAVDVGVAGVVVTAYDAAGTAIATATTNAAGAYTLTSVALTALPAGVPLRIQFTALPAGYQSGPQGASNATSVRFVTTTAGALTGINFGVNIPEDYCQNNPRLVTNCFVAGDQTGGQTILFSQPTIHAAAVANGAGQAAESQSTQIGATWGLAYHRRSNTLFASAYIKRIAGLAPAAQHPGSDGTGAIYRITPGGAADGALFLDLDVLFGNAALTGAIGARDFNPINADNNFDAGAYDAVGKMGLGDMDISADDTTLFVVNLADGRLYRLPLGNAAAPVAPTLAQVTSVDVPDPGCVNGVGRPFAIKVRRDQVFVGGVCTAEAVGGTAANLRAYVYSIDLAFAGWSAALLNFQLDYPRGCADIGGYTTVLAPPCRGAITDATDAFWRPWRSTLDETFPAGYGGGFTAHAQPMLTDIEFAGNDIVLGFRDRFADQAGWDDVTADQTPPNVAPANGSNLNAVSAGDILRACWNGVAYVLEANGTCGGQTNGAGNEQGPGAPTLQSAPGGEYYASDALVGSHDELVWGGLAQVPGFPAVAMTAMDPINFFTGGTIQLNNVDGTRVRSYQHYAGANPVGNFQKANGLGDLEALCRAAPIEIGNRVWRDDNRNGVQDPGEPPIAGVTVRLYTPGGPDGNIGTAGDNTTPIATATTNANGEYYFRTVDANDDGLPDADGNLADEFGLVGSAVNPGTQPNTQYTVRLDNAANFGAGGPLDGLGLTEQNDAVPSPSGSDLNDSDAAVANANGIPGGNFPEIILTTAGAGANNHTYDIGFSTSPMSLGNRVWFDTDNDGIVDATETGITGVTVNLYRDTNNDNVPDGGIIATTTTNATGYYLFTNLSAGFYIVEVINPAGYISSTGVNGAAAGPYEPAPDPDTDIDNDDNGTVFSAAAVRSATVELRVGLEPTGEGATPGIADTTPDNSSNVTVDFGFFQPVSLGNLVWNDANNNGLFAVGEAVIQNVVVNLYFDANNNGILDGAEGATLIATDVTDINGLYLFDNLRPGNYAVEIAASNFNGAGPLVGFTSSTGTNGSVTGPYEAAPDPDANATDNDDNGTINGALTTGGIRSALVTLTAGGEPLTENPDNDPNTPNANENLTVDFGVFQPLSLGNRVWFDVNNNGVVDAGDGATPGLSGVTVRLYNGAGTVLLATTTTNATGHYLFTNLAAGDYVVEVVTPAGLTSSTGGGSEPAPDPDANATDNDDNGTVFSATAVRSATVTLAPGTEPVGEGATPGLTDPASDANSNTTVDFGFFSNVPRVSLGNQVWNDANNNGVIDGGEATINGVVVNLYRDANGNGVLDGAENTTVVSTATTAGAGLYLFDNLLPGNYVVEIAVSNFNGAGPLVGFTSSTGTVGSAAGPSEPAPDPDTDQDDGDDNGAINGALTTGGIRSPMVTLTVGGEPTGEAPDNDPNTPDANENLTVDFGVFQPMSLGNLVWIDANNNGAVDAGENGTANVTVRLYDGTGTVLLATTVTNATGHYLFTNLVPAGYVVEVVTPVGYTTSTGTNGSPIGPFEPAPDPDANATDNDDNGTFNTPAAVRSAPVTLIAGGEPVGEGATPGLTDTATDNNSNTTVDFGFYQPVSLGNLVWNDTNNNGLVNGTEAGIAGVTVNLYDATGVTLLGTTTTNATGHYLFTNLFPGTYVVEVVTPAGFRTSTGTNGSTAGPYEPAPDPDLNAANNDDNGTINSPTTVRSAPVTLTVGGEPVGEGATPGLTDTSPDNSSNTTVDFGFFQPVSLGNQVWEDADNNGAINGAEAGINGVTVQLLYDSNGDGTLTGAELTPIATTTTAGGGLYLFSNLAPGNYTVQLPASNFTGPGTLVGSTSSTGGGSEPAPDPDVDQDDNDDNGTTVGVLGAGGVIQSAMVTLTAGGEPLAEAPDNDPTTPDANENLTVDFGVFTPLSLGNLVWRDANNNGVVDAGETGIGGVTVNLYDAAGVALLATTTTDVNGLYLFSNLAPGSYIVEVVTPAGSTSSTDISTSTNPNNDINHDDNGVVIGATTTRSNQVTLARGTEPINDGDTSPNSNLSVDFGFFAPLSLGNQVWADVNNNGLVDGGEAGINGVVVNLYFDSNGNGVLDGAEGTTIIAMATTAAVGPNAGLYLFTGLTAGNYVVELAASNFTGAGVLVGYRSSTGTNGSATGPYEGPLTPDPDTGGALASDGDDNGTTTGTLGAGGVIRSALVTLSIGGEPLAEVPDNDPTTPDANENLTVDFGVFQPMSLGNRVWADLNDSGTIDAADGATPGIVNVSLRLLNAAGTTVIATTTTNVTGHYLFTNLAPGDYVVEVVTPAGTTTSTGGGAYEPAPDPDANPTDNDDNGTTTSATTVRSAVVTLTLGGEPLGEGATSGLTDTATDANSNTTVDFGFISNTPRVSLGNQVWADVNNNGLIDGGEVGINGVVVNLYFDTNNNGVLDGAEATTILATATTATAAGADGLYLFTGLLPGNYLIELAPANFTGAGVLVGFTSSTGTPGSATGAFEPAPDPDANATDNDDNGTITGALGAGGSIRSALVTLTVGGEPLAETPDNDPTTPDANENLTVDFGVFQPMSLGNLVWNDVNNSGTVDGGEVGIGGVTVRLFDGAGAVQIATMTTNASGHYLFVNLLPADYVVEVVTPAGFTSSTGGGAYEPAPDPDANPANNDDNGTTATPTTVRSAPVTLALGGEPLGEGATSGLTDNAADNNSNTTVDFGFNNPAGNLSLGNLVWSDNNNNGFVDGTEIGIPNVTVNLYDATGTTLIAATTTDVNGLYLFTGLAPGSYVVEVVTPAGFVSSTDIATSGAPNNDVNNDDNGVIVAASTVRSGQVTLSVGGEPINDGDADNNSNLSVDFGFRPTTSTLSLGNLVWNDADNDGLVDVGEPGLGFVTVNLYNDTNNNGVYDAGVDTFVATTNTNGGGFYQFTGLNPGNYLVVVDGASPALAGFTSSTGPTNAYEPAPDPDNDVNDDDNGTTQGSLVAARAVTLTQNGEPTNDGDLDNNTNFSVDFGFFNSPLVSVGNLVWLDTNNNGAADGGEPGVGGVVVRLYRDTNGNGVFDAGADQLTATTTTNAAGNYLFSGLQPGGYFVQIAVPAGYNSTVDTANTGNPSSDTDNDDNGAGAAGGALTSGLATLTLGGEPAGGGNYNPTVDFGLVLASAPLSLGNLVWNDADNNGLVNGAEVGIANVTVNLYLDSNNDGVPDGGVIATTVTGGAGDYLFGNLAPGTYIVEAVTPAGFVTSTGAVGGSATGPYEPAPDPDNDINNDDNGTASGGVVRSRPVTLTGGGEPINDGDADPNSNLSVDFGFFQRLQLGNLGWRDANNNGVVDGAETGIPNITVQLYNDVNGNGAYDPGVDLLLATTTTDAAGNYLFTNLIPGNYLVGVTIPAGFVSSTDIATSGDPNNATDNDDNGINLNGASIFSSGVALAADNLRVDFGFFGSAPPPPPPPGGGGGGGGTGGDGSPVVLVLDPLVAKSPDLQTVQQGDPVQFTIVVTNPGTVSVANVVVTDPLAPEITFTGATTTQGSFTFDAASNTVTFNIGTMGAGDVVTMTVSGVANQNAQPPDEFRNTALLFVNGEQKGSTNSVLVKVIPGAVPATGVGPGWREWLAVLMMSLVLVALALPVVAWGVRRQRMVK